MVSSGSSPLAVVRSGLWGFLLFAGVAWLAISWSVLRLEPADIALVAGPVVLFGALMEAVRALSGTARWWLNAGMAGLFTVTGVVLLVNAQSSVLAPVALLGWFLMVRGAADIAMSMMARETDRIWGLLLVVGVLEALLGFFAAGPAARAADLAVMVLGALGLARGVADLVAALRLREAPRVSVLALPAERASGVAGYSAGLTDFDSAPAGAGARHRAERRLSSTQAMDELSTPGGASTAGPESWGAVPGSEAGGVRGADLGTGWNIGSAGPAAHGPAGQSSHAGQPSHAGHAGQSGQSDQPSQSDHAGQSGKSGHADQPRHADQPGHAGQPRHAGEPRQAGHVSNPAGAVGDAESPAAGARGHVGAGVRPTGMFAESEGGSFHDEVLRTTADLDKMLALAGVTGAAVGAALTEVDLPEVPDTPEGAAPPEGAQAHDGGREPRSVPQPVVDDSVVARGGTAG
ncbi:MAG: hypothetical protein QOH97_1796 [Actinoplanes sp.]|jgi:uncharacterized membrane protein HdeD (DUF308 family)|nr:hypothetical protein [Actinoplanes sp.]